MLSSLFCCIFIKNGSIKGEGEEKDLVEASQLSKVSVGRAVLVWLCCPS